MEIELRTWKSPRGLSWLDDLPRRATLEAAAGRAYPELRHRRRQRRDGPGDVYEFVLDIPGYDSRRVSVEFSRRSWWRPRVYVDGPAGSEASPHRFPGRGGRELCLWHSGDSPDRRWEPSDGLLMLFGMTAEHLFKEAWWREHDEWLGEEYPHSDLAEGDHATEGAVLGHAGYGDDCHVATAASDDSTASDVTGLGAYVGA